MVPSDSISSSRLMPMPLSSISEPPLLFGIDRDSDARLRIVAKERGLSDRLVAQPLAGVGRIRDQFAQKHRLLGIDRVHYQLQKLGNIRFEWAAFRSVLLGNGHGGIPGDIFNAICWSEFVFEFFRRNGESWRRSQAPARRRS